MVRRILDVVEVETRKPFHSLKGNGTWNVLELFPKRELQYLAKICRLPRSGTRSDIISRLCVFHQSRYGGLRMKVTLR
jgi:hypothetical protein